MERNKKVKIVLESLFNGTEIEYKNGWKIHSNGAEIVQSITKDDRTIYISSNINVNDLLKFINNISDEQLKFLKSNNTLISYQQKLMNQSNESRQD